MRKIHRLKSIICAKHVIINISEQKPRVGGQTSAKLLTCACVSEAQNRKRHFHPNCTLHIKKKRSHRQFYM